MSDENWTAKADYVRPLGGANRLSLGAQFVTTSNRLAQTATGTLPSGTPFAASSLVDGSWFEYAGYVTYQFELAGFTIMPGVRVEGREYDLGGTTGVPDLKTTNVFPSLHTERQLAPWLTGTAGYSRRTPIRRSSRSTRPDFQDATTPRPSIPCSTAVHRQHECGAREVARTISSSRLPADDRGHLSSVARSSDGCCDRPFTSGRGLDRPRAQRSRGDPRGLL